MSLAGTANRWSKPLRHRVVRSLIERRARARGYAPADLERAMRYLEVSFGFREPVRAHPLQTAPNYFEGLSAKPWHDPDDFPWTRRLQASIEDVRNELAGLQPGHQHEGDATVDHPPNIGIDGSWKIFVFSAYGYTRREAYRQAPRTGALISSIPGLCQNGLSYFSVLSGGTHIAAHCAETNTRLRLQLTLVTPAGCKMRVGDETRPWIAGERTVFDGSFDHEVWHDGVGDRVVLIADFWHPELTEAERWAVGEMTRFSRHVRRYTRELGVR
jgi:aspartate beta-hydroxylase